jgi:hypothetical protein
VERAVRLRPRAVSTKVMPAEEQRAENLGTPEHLGQVANLEQPENPARVVNLEQPESPARVVNLEQPESPARAERAASR